MLHDNPPFLMYTSYFEIIKLGLRTPPISLWMPEPNCTWNSICILWLLSPQKNCWTHCFVCSPCCIRFWESLYPCIIAHIPVETKNFGRCFFSLQPVCVASEETSKNFFSFNGGFWFHIICRGFFSSWAIAGLSVFTCNNNSWSQGSISFQHTCVVILIVVMYCVFISSWVLIFVPRGSVKSLATSSPRWERHKPKQNNCLM